MNASTRVLLIAFVLLSAFFQAMSQPAQSLSATKRIGVGLVRDSMTNELKITNVIANAPAATAGVRNGDVITAVDGKPLASKSLEEVLTLLRGGTEGHAYSLSIYRKIKTSLGETQKTIDLLITPVFMNATTCLSGDCNNGEGKLIDNLNGKGYEGTFVNGTLVKGKTYYPSGRLFQSGTMKDEKVDGADGIVYYDAPDNLVKLQGTFVAGSLRSGTYYDQSSKTKFEGSWDENGNQHGKNIVVSSPTYYFKGSYNHGKAFEAEKVDYKSGYYDGPLVDAKPEGKGTYVEGKYFYKGYFRNGLMEGKFRVIHKSRGGSMESILYYRKGVEQSW